MTAEDWRAIFGHEEPYQPQVDGIETAIDVAEEGGYLALEGACGTGKTMLALSAGLDLVRDPESDFEQVLVLTSVKQQLRQFEKDLATINSNLPEDWSPISGLTLVGKADLCPYSREGLAGMDARNVYDRCERLRDRTRVLAEEVSSPGELTQSARRQQVGLDDTGSGATYIETAGEMAPYGTTMPEHDEAEFCPFYAQYLEDLPEEGIPKEAVPFSFTDRGLIDTEDLISLSIEHGSCPHSLLGAISSSVEVVIGNYYHAFDPTTAAAMTGSLIDDETFLVCDEAHMLEPRVRDLLGQRMSDNALRETEAELTRVLQPLQEGHRGDGGLEPQVLRAELSESALTQSDLEQTADFLRALREELDRRVAAGLDEEHPGWRTDRSDVSHVELPLRDPTIPETDAMTEWATAEGFNHDWIRAESVCSFVGRVLEEATEDEVDHTAPRVGRVLGSWERCDHESYFRSIVVESGFDETAPDSSWRRYFNAALSLHNCVPGDVIGEQLAEFGGGILMSATLAPMDVFTTVTGLDHLKEEEGRPVETRRYGLDYPAENRESFAVTAPKFTYGNRGSPPDAADAGETTGYAEADGYDVRAVYADAITTVATGPGNVLVGMPSYREAEWAAAVLDGAIDKPVLLDESSGDVATESLKERFFDDPPKVLVTSLRGTLTEGVDYSGDRLSAAVVCGVPIVDTQRPRTKAIRAAYDRAFGSGENQVGFEYALTIPAVRKARQAIGRVIRGPEEVGVRVLVDERYAKDGWDGVAEYVPDEFKRVSPTMLSMGLERFWDTTRDD